MTLVFKINVMIKTTRTFNQNEIGNIEGESQFVL